MKLMVENTDKLAGKITAPPSKSHTHRAITIASMAAGESVIENPLICDDCLATIEACQNFGATIQGTETLNIIGVGGRPQSPDVDIDVKNSGTTMRFMAAVSGLCKGATTLTGDDSVLSRPIGPLLKSILDLGAKRARSLKNDECPPISITGKITGGSTVIDGQSSQFVSALLIACPMAENDSIIEVKSARSWPYVNMTLEHLDRAGVKVWSNQNKFFIPGKQPFGPFRYTVPGDYSSAAFMKVAAEITGSEIQILGLDPNDIQGDRAIDEIMIMMLAGEEREIDLQDNPDLLPILAVLGCHVPGKTKFKNVEHARLKESDRISTICAELRKMGAEIEELPDGLLVCQSELKGAELDGHRDHRIVMALAIAGLIAKGRTIISDADTISISYPNFVHDLAGLGANIRTVEQ